jgi:hypothetical protein
VEIAETIVRQNPSQAEYFSDVPLTAAGLIGLYDRLCDHSDDPVRFSRLPEVAKIYFAVIYFEADCSNGGIGQALGNSTGDHLALVRKGYEDIGDARSQQFLEAMLKPFGSAGPSADREERNRQMKSMTPDYWSQEESLEEKRRQQAGDEQGDNTEWLLNKYAARHSAVLKPLLKKPGEEQKSEHVAKPE